MKEKFMMKSLLVWNSISFNSTFAKCSPPLLLFGVTPYFTSSLPCREREGCGGEEGEAVTAEESQTGDQRRQDGEQSIGESIPHAVKLCFFH